MTNKTSTELIQDIYRNESKRLRRIAVFGIVVILLLVGALGFLYNELDKTNSELKLSNTNLAKQIEDNRAAREIDEEKAANRQRATIRYIKCLADILIVAQRKQIELVNLEECQYRDIRRNINSTIPPSTGGTSSQDPAIQSSEDKAKKNNQGNNNNNGGNPPPDNDGVIVDLPLLPKIHIPSPL